MLLVSVIDIGLIWLDTDIFGIIHITIFSRQGTQMLFFSKIESTIRIGYNSLFYILLHIFNNTNISKESSEVLLKATRTMNRLTLNLEYYNSNDIKSVKIGVVCKDKS